ncbi:MAG TPA: hypothetical protein IAC62_17275 [Candidatus Pelethocola excrementipullorum]|nr:hypothetical protein [Candidatus Pelethocola excrementipullorum]
MSEEKVKSGRKRYKVIGGIILLLGLIAMVLGGVLLFDKIEESKVKTTSTAFHSDEGRRELKYVDMIDIADTGVVFDVGENHGVYMILDQAEELYLSVLPKEDYEKYVDDIENGVESFKIEGYPMEIDTDLMDFTIEFSDEIFGEGVITKANFVDVFGSYYLDTTYKPKADINEPLGLLGAGVFLFIIGIILILIKNDKTPAAGVEDWGERIISEAVSEDGVRYGNAVLEEVPVNHGLGILGAVLGSLLGAVIWIGVYQLGYVVWIVGYLTVVFAIYFYKKFAKGIGSMGIAISGLISIVMLFLADVAAIAYELVKFFNEENPGRASLTYILSHFTELMTSYDLWVGFTTDMLFGVVAALVAMVSLLVKHRKKKKALN